MLQEHNVVNKNIALSYAVYKYLNFVMPWAAQYWADTMKDLELQIDNNNVDPSSPVGIGNLAGECWGVQSQSAIL